jgi:hypothetical protein
VLIGLAEFFDLVPDIQRLGSVVSMAPFDSNITRQFIEKCQLAASGKPKLFPFTLEVVDTLVGLTGGNPRKIQLYCGQLFRIATSREGQQRHVTVEMVYDVARTHHTVPPKKGLRDAIWRILESHGWEPIKDYYASASRLHRVDLWVPMGTESAGCAILLADAVIEERDLEELKARAEAIRGTLKDCEMFLITGGPLAPSNVPELVRIFGREPLVYDVYSFAEDVVSVMKAITHRFELMAGSDAVIRVQKLVENVGQQVSRTQQSLFQLTTTVRDLRSSSDQEFGLIRRELDDIAQAITAEVDPLTELPAEVNEIFEERLRSLKRFNAVVMKVMEEALALGSGSKSSPKDATARIHTLFRDSDSVTRAIGATDLLDATTQAFRRGVIDWFRSYFPTGRARLQPGGKRQLENLCLTYDAIYELLPLYALEPLAALADELEPRSMENAEAERSHLHSLREKFEYLGAEVRRMVLSLVPR